jgi:uncharacterized protein YciI
MVRSYIIALLLLIGSTTFAQTRSYSVIILNKKTDLEPKTKEEVDKLMEGHMANINRLAKEGKLLAAGPFEGGGGLFILNTTSVSEAKEWVSTDPAVKANRWNVEILPYTPRYGSVCLVNEPYEMVMYNFIRYDAVVSKSTASSFPQIIKKHNDYLKQLASTGNVVTEAIFGENDGGILIMKGDLQKEVIEADPGLQEGLIDIQMKQLYIAKGAFCEK